MNCEWIAFAVIASTAMVIDCIMYLNGGRSWFFKDTSEIEKLNREIDLIEARKKLEKLKSEEQDKSNLMTKDVK